MVLYWHKQQVSKYALESKNITHIPSKGAQPELLYMEYLVRFGAKPWLDAAKSPTRNFRFSAEGRESIPVLLEGHESTKWAT